MERAEMVEILEEIIRDKKTNPTARVTAIRAWLEIAPKVDSSQFDGLYDEVALRRSGKRSR